MIEEILAKCSHPYLVNKKEKRIYLQIEDLKKILAMPLFVGAWHLPDWNPFSPFIGKIYGWEIYQQDEIQMILLSIKEGGRNEDQNQM